MANDRPTRGVFITWDEEEITPERHGAGTMQDRTVVVACQTIVKQALWSNTVTDKTIAAAERYAESIKDQYDNVRVQVFTGKPGSTR